MSKANCSTELKEHILSEHATGELISSLARKYEPSATAIRNWKRQAKLKASAAVLNLARAKTGSCVN